MPDKASECAGAYPELVREFFPIDRPGNLGPRESQRAGFQGSGPRHHPEEAVSRRLEEREGHMRRVSNPRALRLQLLPSQWGASVQRCGEELQM
ncbi:hypothetical protein MATL_G00191150 [Megalops atlanticus]|uniref:Uncharacterized protein n=1 Tax=Megalops atlanticus TaxID=7932 RepID=A0A9D3PLM4_MEGAT|nr:hypothetical protein MATL_G00191150 [Megalops atlanticus]